MSGVPEGGQLRPLTGCVVTVDGEPLITGADALEEVYEDWQHAVACGTTRRGFVEYLRYEWGGGE